MWGDWYIIQLIKHTISVMLENGK